MDGATELVMNSAPNFPKMGRDVSSESAGSEPLVREKRTRALLSATLSTFDNASSTACLVNNISATGARLIISESIPIGAEFKVSIPQRNIYRTARQIWRRGDQLGISFQPEAAPRPEHDDKDAKIGALEAEVASLKAEIKMLKTRLFQHEES